MIFLGIYGYFVEASVRIAFSIPQVLSVLLAMVAVTVIDVLLFRNAKKSGEANWGKIAPISQYVLIFIAVTFTWLMGLMGYVRSGLRQHWHVYGVIRDYLGRRLHPHAGFRHQDRLGHRADLLRPDQLRLLAGQPGRQEGLGAAVEERSGERPACVQ